MTAGQSPSNGGPPGAKLNGMFSSLGDFGRALYRRDDRLDKVLEIQNAMSERVPADGGFLVPEEFRQDLVLASIEEAITRPRAIVVPMGSLRLGLPATDQTTDVGSLMGGWTATWVEENVSIPENNPSFQNDRLEAKKLTGFNTVNNELLADTDALDAWLRQTLPKAVAYMEDDAFIQGQGQAEPRGAIFSSGAVQVARGTGGTIVHGDVVGMSKRLWPQGWKRASWLCSPDTFGFLLDIYEVVGVPSNQALPNSMWLKYDTVKLCWELLGLPLYPTEHVPAYGNTGDLSLLDLGAYVIGDRAVMQMRISPHNKFAFDQSVIRVVHRVDGRLWVNSPITPANSANTVSPVVVLQ